MIEFEVATMRCGGCAARITRAIRSIDPQARVRVDGAARVVSVEPGAVGAGALAEAIRGAGHDPVPRVQA